MKKSIFNFLIISIFALLFVSCNPEEKKDAVTNIIVNPTELRVHPGETVRLSVSVVPENASYNSDDFVWSVSDSTVINVSQNGTVTVLSEGTSNVIVSYKELSSICHVIVAEWIKDLSFTGVYFGIRDTAAYGDELDTIQSLSGEDFVVKKVEAYVAVFTVGFYINNNGELSGASKGGILETHAPMFYAPSWANHSDHGTYFCLGDWYVYDTIAPQCMLPGSTNELYITNMSLFLDNIMAGDQTTAYSINMKDAGDKGCEGSCLTVYEYHNTAEGYGSDGYYSNYIPSLFFTSGYFYAGNDYAVSNYMCSVEGHHLVARELLSTEIEDNGNFYSWGCHWNYDATNNTYCWVDEVIAFDEPITYDYNLEIFADAPARREMSGYKEIKKVHDMKSTKAMIKKIHSYPKNNK